jgi:outer membrane protein assembly factor BamA
MGSVTLFSDSELSTLIPFRPGEIYNRSKIAEGLKALTNLYDSMGYINATYVPTPETNGDAGTVAFEIENYLLHFVPWLRYRASPNGELKLVETQ